MKKIVYLCSANETSEDKKDLLARCSQLREYSHNRYQPWIIMPHHDGVWATELREAGIEFSVVVMPPGLDKIWRRLRLPTTLPSALAIVRQLSLTTPRLTWYLYQLRKELTALKPDLIHSLGFKAHWLAALPLHRQAVLWHLRDWAQSAPLNKLMLALADSRGIHIAANSLSSAKELGKSQTYILADSVAPTSGERLAQVQNLLGLPAQTPLIGSCGPLERRHGQREFISIADHMLRAGSPAHFVIMNSNPHERANDMFFKQRLQRQIRSRRLKGRVHILPRHFETTAFLRSLQLFVHCPRHSQGFVRTLALAAACKTPVIAAHTSGAADFLQDGHSVVLRNSRATDEFAAAAYDLLAQPERRTQLSENAYQIYQQHFTQEAHLRHLVSIYDQILAEQPTAPKTETPHGR